MHGSCCTALLERPKECAANSLDIGRISEALTRHSQQQRRHDSRYRKAPNEPHIQHSWERNALYRSYIVKCDANLVLSMARKALGAWATISLWAGRLLTRSLERWFRDCIRVKVCRSSSCRMFCMISRGRLSSLPKDWRLAVFEPSTLDGWVRGQPCSSVSRFMESLCISCRSYVSSSSCCAEIRSAMAARLSDTEKLRRN